VKLGKVCTVADNVPVMVTETEVSAPRVWSNGTIPPSQVGPEKFVASNSGSVIGDAVARPVASNISVAAKHKWRLSFIGYALFANWFTIPP
jgi:hypothetical protein